MKYLIFDMYGVIIKEAVGDFYSYTYSHFDESKHEHITKCFYDDGLYTKAGYGEITSNEFLSLLGFDDPEFYMKDYIANCLTLDKNFVPFVKRFRDKYKFVLLSTDVSEWSKYILEYHGFNDLFEKCIVSGDVHMRKPCDEIYKLTLKELSTTAENCIFVDNLPANLEPAEKLGIRTILFNRASVEYSGEQVTSFIELAELL